MSSWKNNTVFIWINSFIDFKKILSILYLPRYICNWLQFQKSSAVKIKFRNLYPCLSDFTSSTPFDPHYFYQGAWLSRSIHKSNLAATISNHYDIGSDIRLISVISSFIPIKFIDIRPLDVNLVGLECMQGDLANLNLANNSISSLSCLHVIEHIGLGRYNDKIDPLGCYGALKELERVLDFNGTLFLSVPVGKEVICFNAHRIFNPYTIVNNLELLTLTDFSLITDSGNFIENSDLDYAASQFYGCGLFTFKKFSPKNVVVL